MSYRRYILFFIPKNCYLNSRKLTNYYVDWKKKYCPAAQCQDTIAVFIQTLYFMYLYNNILLHEYCYYLRSRRETVNIHNNSKFSDAREFVFFFHGGTTAKLLKCY